MTISCPVSCLKSWVLLPLSYLFELGSRFRMWLYSVGVLKSHACGKPVISIGNLTTGGTGKTPFTAWLVEELKQRGLKPVIVSRGYRSTNEKNVARVDLAKSIVENTKDFGDEPVLLARRTKVPVYVGCEKVAVARRAVEQERPDVVIADDAFQHRRLKRNVDIVLLDATAPSWQLRLLPAGRLRESFAALQRADAIVLTKVNLADVDHVRELRERVRGALSAGGAQQPLWLEVDYRLRQFVSLKTSVIIEATSLKSVRVILMSALAQPDGFARLVQNSSGCEIVGHEVFPDHHFFRDDDLARVAEKVRQTHALKVLITEKDAVKLDPKVLANYFSCDVLVSQLTLTPRDLDAPSSGAHAGKQFMDEVHVRFDRLAR